MNNVRFLLALLLSVCVCIAQGETESDQNRKTNDDYEREIPQQVDWTQQRVVSRVINQGRYPTSWAFAAIGLLESRLAIKTHRNVQELSKQNLIDCTQAIGHRVRNAIRYIKQRGWIATEKSYSYRGFAENCRDSDVARANVKIDKYYELLPSGDEQNMAREVARGPVVAFINKVAIDKYTSGILSDVECGNSTDYAVLVVGYGRTEGQDYWLLKTSRGVRFGEQGYMKLARNQNGLCGINKKVSFLTLEP